MFDEKIIRKFRLHAWELDDVDIVYVFVEDGNDIMDINNKLWQLGDIPDIKDQFIRVSGDRNMVYPNGRIIQLLHLIYKFYGRTYLDRSGFESTLLGDYDLALIPTTRVAIYFSLLPHISFHDKMWLNDLAMEGSPTYFINLFDVKLWFAFLIIFALIGLLSTLGIILLKKFTKDNVDLLNWYAIAIEQGANENSQFISRRLLLITLSIVTIIFHSAFGAFMSSSLAIRYIDLPFDDIKSLLNLPSFTVCVLDFGTAEEQISHDLAKIKNSALINTDDCPNIFQNFDGTSKSITSSEMSCPKTRMVYIGEGMCFFPQMTQHCSMTSLPGKYFNDYAAMMKYPGFKYYEQLNQGILHLRSAGHLDKLTKDFDLRSLHSVCAQQYIPPESDVRVIYFVQIRYILVIPLVGIICSVMLLIIEIYCYKLFN